MKFIKSVLRCLPRPIKSVMYIAFFPLYSLFSDRFGFTVFFRRQNAWYARTRGVVFPVREPGVAVLEYFRHFIAGKGEVVFDVGGEFGYETEQFAGLVGSSGRVFVFECLPGHIAKLKEIAARFPQVTLVDAACWNSPCELEFFVGNTPGSNTAIPEAKGQHGQALANSDGETIRVRAETLDTLWRELHGCGTVDFLKMDIEGAEYEALDGATQMLSKTRRAVIAAYHIRDGIPTAALVEQKLRAAGFNVRTDENLHVYAWR
jgi:FkbM family methyltransferase